MGFIRYRGGDSVLMRARVLVDCSDFYSHFAFAPLAVEEDYPSGIYVAHVLAPFSEICPLGSEQGLARLRLPRVIDPATAKR